MYKGKLSYLEKLTPRLGKVSFGTNINGSSPPSVFVGREGYPKVFVGPMVTQNKGDTAVMDTPEQWLGKFDALGIVNFRMQLIRGIKLVAIKDVGSPTVEKMKEIAMAKDSVEAETEFEKKPRGYTFNVDHQPFGPSAPLKKMEFGNVYWEQHMEKAYHDTDLLSQQAVIGLYDKGLLVSQIQKSFSVGAFGVGKNRKLVPTRWSITAVDDMLAKNLLAKVKNYPLIDEYRVHISQGLNNRFIVILMPTPWKYESMEAFFPQIIGQRLEIYSDYEHYDGRKDYAQIGGGYYSAKLAVCEALEREKKQAGAIVLREAYEGYIPLGVWNVRELMRKAMASSSVGFESLRMALEFASSKLLVPINGWIEKGHLIKECLSQKRLTEY